MKQGLSGRPFSPLTACLLGLSLTVGAALTGCRAEHVQSTGADDSYIRMPGETPPPAAIGSGPVLPLTPGTKWSYAVHTSDREGKIPPKNGEETLQVIGPRTVLKATGTAIQIFQNGKPFREEVYNLDSDSLTLVAAGINNPKGGMDTMAITPSEAGGHPGIPLIRFPVKEGVVIKWEGILRLMKNNIAAPGTAASRVGMVETVKTPAGSFVSYRVDTVITTTVQGQQIYLYSARWLSPGVGLVKQRIIAGSQIVQKELTAFTLAGGKPVAVGLAR